MFWNTVYGLVWDYDFKKYFYPLCMQIEKEFDGDKSEDIDEVMEVRYLFMLIM